MNVPAGVTPHYSDAFDTRFLELPPGKVLLATLKNIPTRPTAEIDLKFVEKTNSIDLQVVENKMQPKMVSYVARWNGETLEFCFPQYDNRLKRAVDNWSAWDTHKRWSNEVEGLCYRVLLSSDVGCPNQAQADFPTAIKSPLWTALWNEMQRLQAVASVMLT